MVLTATQHAQIAAAYERAAEDESLPAQSRAAFAKKASWFRMLAQIGRAKEIGARSSASCEQKLPRKPSNIRGQTLTERLSRARPIDFLTAKQATDGARHDRRQAEADW
jgi:hypothetical protein